MENDTPVMDKEAALDLGDGYFVGKIEQLDRIEETLARIEKQNEAIATVILSAGEQLQQFQGLFEELENSPTGNMLFNMLGLNR